MKRELLLIELIFTIPKHSKSSVAWYHRQWILSHFNQVEINISKEFKICTMTSSLYPRNYYSWTYRHWILCTYCVQNMLMIENEYRDTCHWIETNITDYSGFNYLQQLMKMLGLVNNQFEMDQHMKWLNNLIIKYPGQESLWCHRRFCSNLFIHSLVYCNLQHEFIKEIMNDTYKNVSLSNDENDFIMQKDFALKFGLWQTLLVSFILLIFMMKLNGVN